MTTKKWLKVLFAVEITNFLVQLPYYYHQYYALRYLPPSAPGVLLMGAVLIWFLGGYYLLYRGTLSGYRIMMAFLSVEFLFYLQTQIVQALSGNGVLLHVIDPRDPVLFIVFAVGYANFYAAGWFWLYLRAHKGSIVHLDK